jgi:hypothetical protein
MAKRISIGIALAFGAVLTYGMVNSGIHLESSRLMPFSTYDGFFARVLVATWSVWGRVRGLEPMSHVDEFGRFYACFVFLACPLIGFALFRLGSQQKIGSQLWKPLAIAIVICNSTSTIDS